jgi:hypothetical protein
MPAHNLPFWRACATALPLILLHAPPAAAQSADDVVVMRRVVAPSHLSAAPSHAAAWHEGGWTFDPTGKTCSDAAPQSQQVTCQANGKDVAPALCRLPKPSTTRTQPRYETCVVDWAQGGWGAWTPSCGETSTRHQTVQCLRTGGDSKPFTMNEALCTKPRPTEIDHGDATAGCSYTGTYAAYGRCEPSAPGATTGTVQRVATSCTGTGPDGVASPVALDKCGSGGSETCTFAYIGTYSAIYGSCSAQGFQYAPIAKCTMAGSGRSEDTALSYCTQQQASRTCDPTKIINGDFTVAGGWDVAATAGIAGGTFDTVRGVLACATGPTSTSGKNYCAASHAITVKSGTTYTVTAQVANTSGDLDGTQSVSVSDAVSGKSFGTWSAKMVRGTGTASVTFVTTATTTRIKVTLTASRTGLITGSAQYTYFDNVTLQ